MNLGKKGAMLSYNTMIMIMRVIFLVVAMLVVVIIVGIVVNMSVETQHTEAHLLMARILYSPEGISLNDPITGRVNVGVVNLDNFDNSRLDHGIYVEGNDRIAAKVELYGFPRGSTSPVFMREAKFNSQYYDIYLPMAEAWHHKTGIGGVDRFEECYPVIIQYKDGFRDMGKVCFDVLIPRGSQ